VFPPLFGLRPGHRDRVVDEIFFSRPWWPGVGPIRIKLSVLVFGLSQRVPIGRLPDNRL